MILAVNLVEQFLDGDFLAMSEIQLGRRLQQRLNRCPAGVDRRLGRIQQAGQCEANPRGKTRSHHGHSSLNERLLGLWVRLSSLTIAR